MTTHVDTSHALKSSTSKISSCVSYGENGCLRETSSKLLLAQDAPLEGLRPRQQGGTRTPTFRHRDGAICDSCSTLQSKTQGIVAGLQCATGGWQTTSMTNHTTCVAPQSRLKRSDSHLDCKLPVSHLLHPAQLPDRMHIPALTMLRASSCTCRQSGQRTAVVPSSLMPWCASESSSVAIFGRQAVGFGPLRYDQQQRQCTTVSSLARATRWTAGRAP